MKISFVKTISGLVPASPEDVAWYEKLQPGEVCTGEFRRKQNSAFHRKMMALITVGFNNWKQAPIEVSVGGKTVIPEKNFDRFRKDLTILAGFYHITYRLDGSYRVEADSLSYDKMPPEDREKIYSKFIDVLLANVYGGEITSVDMENIVNAYLAFA